MKIAEGMEIIKAGWVHKPKGFRVKFQTQTETGLEPGYSPPAQASPLTSDVTAWRYAWKLWQATRKNPSGTLYNITVVDDQDRPFRYYGTGEFKTYNPLSVSKKME